METTKSRIWPRVLILVIGIPVFLLALAVCDFAAYVYSNNDRFLPNVFIDGTDVSLLTYDDAMLALKLNEYDARAEQTEVSVAFPDGSVLTVTGDKALFHHDALAIIDEAFSSGRGAGLYADSVTFLKHQRGVSDSYQISYILDAEPLRSLVFEFTHSYNNMLEGSKPQIFEDKIVFVAGAGQVCASEPEIFEMAYYGLLDSLHSGLPVSISYALPESGANMSELVSLWQDLLIRPVSAAYNPETKTVSECSIGVGFDLLGASALLGEAESGKTVSIDMIYTQPEVTSEYLEALLFRDLIGECSTNIAGSLSRLNNITLAASAIDGVILEPLEEFSFNRVVGIRTSARGYKMAPAILNGQLALSIGGGICQVSSTIYSAIKDTDLLVTERRPHSRPVPYLPKGRDAAIAWGAMDFRFVNNTEYPIRVDITIEDRTMTAQVFGTITGEWS